MKRILLMSLLAISTALSAQKPVELELWPRWRPQLQRHHHPRAEIREQPDFQCQ